jgi:hypothetical protein
MNMPYPKMPENILAATRILARRRSLVLTTLTGAALSVVALSYETRASAQIEPATDPADVASSNTAIADFWQVYHGNAYDRIPEVQVELESALQKDQINAQLYALLGATHFWHIGEYTRDAHPDLNVLQNDMPTAASLFNKAFHLNYYGPHPIGFVNDDRLPGYWGITMFHTAKQVNDAKLMATADATLSYARYQFPEFNSFNYWAAHGSDPKDSDTYKQALEALWQGIDACVQGSVDRNDPDLKPYLYLYTRIGRKRVCWWDGEVAPYSYEGYLLNLGNGLGEGGADRCGEGHL